MRQPYFFQRLSLVLMGDKHDYFRLSPDPVHDIGIIKLNKLIASLAERRWPANRNE